jgi:hypothetical protein
MITRGELEPKTTNQITVCKRIQSRQKLGPSKHAANARLSLFVVQSSQVDQLADQFVHENGNFSSNRVACYEVVYKLLKKSKMLHKPRTEHCSYEYKPRSSSAAANASRAFVCASAGRLSARADGEAGEREGVRRNSEIKSCSVSVNPL